jgi:hypothetical protein
MLKNLKLNYDSLSFEFVMKGFFVFGRCGDFERSRVQVGL